MEIQDVRTEKYFRYIPLKGWESVVTAITTFAGGATKGARATENHQMQAVGRSEDALGLAVYSLRAPHMKGATNNFLEELLTSAEAALSTRDRWHRGYDYDGYGPFFKTGVDILVLNREEDMFGLGISAAYVGDEPEQGLAEALDIPRALLRATVIVETAPADEEHFEFDFEELLRKLNGVLDMESIGGEEIASLLVAGENDPLRSNPPFVLNYDEDVQVTISPGRVERRVYTELGESEDMWMWEASGPVLRGLLRNLYEDPDEKVTPTVVITASATEGEDGRTPAIYKQKDKQKILALADSIAEALK